MSILRSTFKELVPNPAMRAAIVLATAALLVTLWRMDSVQREIRSEQRAMRADIEKDIESIRSEQQAMRGDIESIRTEQQAMRGDIEKIEGQLSSVQSTLDQIKGALFGQEQVRGSAPAD